MAGKRKDKKGRILLKNESERSDGRYQYRYTDVFGKRQTFYAPTLDELRQKEKELQRALDNGISYSGGKMTINELVEKYLALKSRKCYSTVTTYQSWADSIKQEPFSQRSICDVTKQDAQLWFQKMQETGRAYSTLSAYKKLLKPAFSIAIDSKLLLQNPFDFRMDSVASNDTVKRNALTDEVITTLLDFLKNDKQYARYYDVCVVLLYTGMRVSEFCGLTTSDLDFEQRTISINKQLLRRNDGSRYIQRMTKTKAGMRTLFMSDAVSESLHNMIREREKQKVSPMIDQCGGFLMLTRQGNPVVACNLEVPLKKAVTKYNAEHPEKLLPRITPHIFRHTFCSNMLNDGVSLPNTQAMMGHENPNTTLTYAHPDATQAMAEMARINRQREQARASV